MNSITQVEVAQEVEGLKVIDPNLGAYGFSNLGEVVQFASLMSNAGPMLPEHCQGKAAICLAVTMRASQWGFDPFALAQETFQVKPNAPIAYSAKVFVSALRNCANITLQYRYVGELKILDEPAKSARGNVVAQRSAVGNRKCIAFAEVDGILFEYETPELDNITIKNSALWHNDPDQQLAYYAGRGWARRHRPEVMMGAYSTDEVESMPNRMRNVTPAPATGGFAAKAIEAKAKAQGEDQTEPADEQATDTSADTSEETGAETEQDQKPEEHQGMAEYQAGQNAAAEGFDRSDCPHKDDAEKAKSWIAGFNNAAEGGEE